MLAERSIVATGFCSLLLAGRCSMADAWQTLHANQTYGAKRSPTCDWYRVPKNERDLFSLADERRPVEW